MAVFTTTKRIWLMTKNRSSFIDHPHSMRMTSWRVVLVYNSSAHTWYSQTRKDKTFLWRLCLKTAAKRNNIGVHLTILYLLGRFYFKNRSVRKVLDSKITHRKNSTICIVKPPKPDGFGGNSGCGGRTRTYDLRVMRATSAPNSFLFPSKKGNIGVF